MMKKKIALCITHVQLGGAQKYVLTLARALRDSYDVYVLSSFEGVMQSLFTSLDGVHLIRIPQLRRTISPVDDVKSFFVLRRIFKQHDFELIHWNSPKVSFLGRLAAWSVGARAAIVYTVHLVDFAFPCRSLRDLLFLTIERILSGRTDCIIVNTDYENKLLCAAGFPKARVKVVVPGIETQPFISVRERRCGRQFLVPPYRLLHITSFKPHKDPFFFLAFAESLIRDYPHVHFDVVGDGPLRNRCERYLKQHGLTSSVTLHGWQDDITPFMAQAAFLVITSERESLTYAALEARVAGLKILSFYRGTLLELIQGGGGYFLEKNAKEAGLKVKNLLQNLESIYTINEAAPISFAAQWGFERMVCRIQEIYEHLWSKVESR